MILAVVIVRIIFSRFLVALICTVTEVVVVVTNFPFQSMARSHNCQDFKHCKEVYGWPKPELAKWIVLLHETEQKLRKAVSWCCSEMFPWKGIKVLSWTWFSRTAGTPLSDILLALWPVIWQLKYTNESILMINCFHTNCFHTILRFLQ